MQATDTTCLIALNYIFLLEFQHERHTKDPTTANRQTMAKKRCGLMGILPTHRAHCHTTLPEATAKSRKAALSHSHEGRFVPLRVNPLFSDGWKKHGSPSSRDGDFLQCPLVMVRGWSGTDWPGSSTQEFRSQCPIMPFSDSPIRSSAWASRSPDKK